MEWSRNKASNKGGRGSGVLRNSFIVLVVMKGSGDTDVVLFSLQGTDYRLLASILV
jgi:hypothetical protein